MPITLSDLKRELKPWILSLVTGGGAGTYAPVNSPFLTVGNDSTLTAERAIVAGTHLTGVDAGANSTYTLNFVVESDVNWQGYGITNIDRIDFDLTPATSTVSEGRMFWNTDDGTLNLGMPGGNVNLQLGQEGIVRVKNETGAPIVNGQLVYISGGTGNRPIVSLAKADAISTSDGTVAMATETIADNQSGYVTTWGYVRDINTLAYAPGTLLYLSAATAGAYTSTEPTAPNHVVKIGQVIRQHATEGIIYINIRVGWHLSELHDVLLTSPATNSLLTYNGTLWIDSAYTITSGGSAYTLTIPATGTAAIGAGTLTVSTTNDTATATHTHAITSSSNPGAAASILATAPTTGYLQLTGLGVGGAVTSSTALYVTKSLSSGSTQAFDVAASVGSNVNFLYAHRTVLTLGISNSSSYTAEPIGAIYSIFANSNHSTTNATSLTASIRLLNNTPTVTNWRGLSVWTPSVTTGTLSNVYAIYIADQNIGSTSNYAFYSNLGLVRFGDTINQVVGSALTNAVQTNLTLDHNTSGTAAAGFGTRQLFRLESSTTADQSAGSIITRWTDATHASRASSVVVAPWYTTTEREALIATATSAGSYVTTTGRRVAIAIKSGDYTLTSSDDEVVFTATATATLPAATGTGQRYRIICRAGVLTIDANSTETIKGSLTQTLTAGEDLIITDTASGIWE